ncbi:MAG: hypothetical protein WC967_05280 [Balneolaceae bacterium]
MTLLNSSYITRLASILLAVGFFYSCASSKVNIDTLVANNNYEGALTQIDKELAKNPNQPALYYQKAVINGRLATDVSPAQRAPFYTSLTEALDSTKELGSDNQELIEKSDSLAHEYWMNEYSKGLNSYETDSKNGSYDETIAHAINAIILNNRDIKGYKLLSVAQYNNSQIDAAIITLNDARVNVENEAAIFEDLGFLYLEIGNAEQSAYYYSLANTDLVKNKNVAFGLVNAYIAADDNANALDLLNQLANTYPKDAQIHNVYGTQLYKETCNLFEQLSLAYNLDDSNKVADLKVEIELVSELAEEQLIKAYKSDMSDVEFIESLAVFYNNMAGNYFSQLETVFDNDAVETQEKALDLVDFAISYYSKLSDISTHNEQAELKLVTLNKLKSTWAIE